MADWKLHGCRSKHPSKFVIQCQSCTGLLIGNTCFEHHETICEKATRDGNQWTPSNYVAIPKHDQNDSFLCKWLDCRKCKLQQALAKSKPKSYLGLRIRLVHWCRITYLLIAKYMVKLRLKLTCKFPKLDSGSISAIVDFVT